MVRAALDFCVLFACLHVVAPAQEGTREEVAEILEKTRDPIELRRSLVFLGDRAIEPLFEVWVAGRVPAEWRGGASSVLALDDSLKAVVVSVFDALPEDPVRHFLDELAGRETPRDVRLQAVRLLGEIGDARSLRLLAALATPLEAGRGPIRRILRTAFADGLRRSLEREVIEVSHLRELFAGIVPGLRATLVEVMSEVPGSECARSLAALLGRQRELDPLILSKIAGRERSPNPLDDEDLRTAVRSLLSSSDPMVLASAARASGILRDEIAVEDLVRLVAHEHYTVAMNAADALKNITALGFGVESGRWGKWYDEEIAWWQRRSPDVLLALETAEGVEFTRAIVHGLERRLYRDRIAASLVLRLRDDDPDRVRLSCAALAQLGTGFAFGELVECLDSRDERVREAAHSALKRITGKDLPPRKSAWDEDPSR